MSKIRLIFLRRPQCLQQLGSQYSYLANCHRRSLFSNKKTCSPQKEKKCDCSKMEEDINKYSLQLQCWSDMFGV